MDLTGIKLGGLPIIARVSVWSSTRTKERRQKATQMGDNELDDRILHLLDLLQAIEKTIMDAEKSLAKARETLHQIEEGTKQFRHARRPLNTFLPPQRR